MNYLEMKHIKKHFDELEVLKDISLNVRLVVNFNHLLTWASLFAWKLKRR